ncbi:NPCBM/NEW2 domain-containing protein [Actinomadura sp. DC4]|uniref:NPCBM/NEW2 domain-containing protein n=1 Tax=Actinomadura sp. DC4 TaxID=3055069 RepID=UPI0025B0D028|nr:NPCBM/NEW2 domain-containing protein [Actinomadura sp. DC4]MDN3357740.1 NPCBM/NEW2 domain-containing protein [Actinomadura sp. DC4]
MIRPTRLIAIGAAVVAVLAPASPASARHHHQPPPAATPPMGWNDWYTFSCDVNEQLVEQTADAMVASGMREAGYRYVNLDDCWAASTRDADGRLRADPAKFPHGMKALADYVHARGLKLGIYEDVGTKTCAGYPGSYGHVQDDADSFASWGVDFVKVDWCNVPFGDFPGLSQQQVAVKLYTAYGQALKATGRPMVFSICEWDPRLQPWTWAPAIGNLWRTDNDYGSQWSQTLANLDQEAPLAPYAGPGHWNDPDILMVGKMASDTESRAHFSAWAMLAAPLLAGNDLRNMSAATKAILTDREVIAIDQDPRGAQATRLSHTATADVWTRTLANGDRAVMLLNRSDTTTRISTGLPSGAYAVRDLWAHRTASSAGVIAASVPPHGAALYRVSPLRGGAGRYPPLTEVSVDPQVPPAYPGSDLHVAEAGEKITTAAAFGDDGNTPVTNATLRLSGPSGWKIDGRPVRAPAVPTGGRLSGTWQVTVPADVKPGSYALTGTATYKWRAHTATVRSETAVRVLAGPAGSPYLSDLSWLSAANGYGPVLVDKSYFGGPLTIHGTTYQHGLWTNAVASIEYYLGGRCSRLTADLGLDDSVKGQGSVTYRISADGRPVYDSGVVTNATPTAHVDVPLTGAHVLRIDVGDGGDGISYDNADIAQPHLTCAD